MLHIYKASAGSGKTYTLTLEYIKLLLGYRDEQGNYCLYKASDESHRRILAVTFTNKATEEMKQRIVMQLDILAHDPDESSYINDLTTLFRCDVAMIRNIASETLNVLLHDFSYFNISTIDRFFQQVLRNFTREVGLQGSFEVEMDNQFVTATAIDRMYSELDNDNQQDLLNWLVAYAQERIESGRWWSMGNHADRKDDLRELAGELNKETYKDCHDAIQEKIKDKAFLDNYLKEMRRIKGRFESNLKQLSEEAMAVIGRYGLTITDFSYKDSSWASNFRKWIGGNLEPPTQRFEEAVDKIEKWFNKKDTPSCAQELYAELNPIAQEVIRLFGEPFVRYNTAVESAKYIYALGILADIGRRIEEYEREHNTLLLSDTAGILNTIIDENDAPFIYEKLGTRINHFMIDEFQDTSNLQWRNFEPLIRESLSRNLSNLIVGDVKQSIYRWRNSDWSLLNERIQAQYGPQYREHQMDSNYRSCARVVEFNNRIFDQASCLLQERFEKEVSESALVENGVDVKIATAYNKIAQQVSAEKTVLPGRVSVSMWYPEEDGFKADALKRIPDLLQELQDRGYKPGDIAFLVRRAKDGVDIVNLLLELNEKNKENPDSPYRYDVISSESLLIKNSPTVNLIIGILRYVQDSAVELNRLLAVYEYSRRKLGSKEGSALLSFFENREDVDRCFDDKFLGMIEQVRKKSLFEMCETIIGYFVNDNSDAGEQVYIQAFQDCVLDYCRSHTVDLGSFLSWWNDNEDTLSVTTPQNQNAIQVMTIHKSKGLEFRVVIIPFCDWNMDHPSNVTNFIWCKPAEAPFNALPVLPLRYSKRLANTYYAADYFEEKMSAYIDNLNVAYVAFTRAGEELHIFAPRISNAGNSRRPNVDTDSNRTISGLLEDIVFADQKKEQGELRYETADEWHAGLMDEAKRKANETKPKKKREREVVAESAKAYTSITPGSRLRLRLQGSGVFGEEGERAYGTLMHRILAEVVRIEDIETTVDAFVRAGELSENEAQETCEKIRLWLDDERVRPWFASEIKVWNERTILQCDGTSCRPDRVVELPDEVVVIDYKFGRVERDDYKEKVSTYVDLIRQMGYPRVSGYLWYVTLDKIVPT